MKRTFLVVMLVLVLVALDPRGLRDLAGLNRVNAQSGGSAASLATGYDLTWYTIDSGGGISDNGGYTLDGTIGQPEAISALSNAGYTLSGGFWFSALTLQQRIYLPLVLKNA